MRPVLALLLGGLIWATPSLAAPEIQEPWFRAEHWRLENGLEVVLIPNHRAPLVHVSLWYRAGGADDLPGKSGTAHFLEHLMFRGVKGEMGHSESIKSWGGDDNAFTSLDVTSYFQTVPVERLDDVLAMEAKRMRRLSVSEKDAETEHGVIQQERRQTVESDPSRIFDEGNNAVFYPGHPYGRAIIGTPAEIKTLSFADALRFHDTWYGPDNAVLVLAGDVKRKDVEPLIARRFKEARPVNPPARPHMQGLRPLADTTRVKRCDARITQTQISIAWPLPASQADLQGAMTAVLVSAMAGGDPSSPLYKTLVTDRKLATAFDLGYGDSLAAGSMMELVVWPAPGQTPDTVMNALPGLVRQTLLTLTQDDLDRARRQIRLDGSLMTDEPVRLAMQVGYNIALGESLESILNWPALLDAVTLDDVRRLALRLGAARLETALLPEGSCALD